MRTSLLVCTALFAATLPGAANETLTPPDVASVSGRVVSTSGEPVEGFCVHLMDDGDQIPDPYMGGTPVGIGVGPWNGHLSWRSMARTDADGSYRIGPAHPGTYKIMFRECGFFSEDRRRYLGQWWPGAPGPEAAKPVRVLGHVTGIDATVVRRTGVAGRVTDSHGAPLAGVCAEEMHGPTDPGHRARTGADGSYRLLPETGAIRVRFYSCDHNYNATNLYRPNWYANRSGFVDAEPIAFRQGDEITGIDARMTPAS